MEDKDQPVDIAVDTLLSVAALTERLCISRRQLEQYREMGKFPAPAAYIRRSPRWTVRSINAWLAENKNPVED